MAISLKHATQSTGGPYTPTGELGPAAWNEEHAMTMATARVLGRVTASTGVVEELTAAQIRTLINVEDGADVTDAVNIASSINGTAAKTTPVDADAIPLIDSAASNALKKVTWANIKATLKTYFDTLYQPVSAALTAIAGLAVTDGNIIVGNGTTWVAESGATARTSLGLGTAATSNTGDFATAAQGVKADSALQTSTEDQTIAGGARVTVKDLGSVSSGTVTPDPGDRPMQKYTNTGAHTLAPGTNYGMYLLTIANGSGAGAITTSGFTKIAGDSFTTTNGHKFRCHISVDADGSLLIVQAMQ